MYDFVCTLQMDKETKTGVITNLVGLVFIFGIALSLGLLRYAFLAIGLQYLVFLVHGYPQNSEKFYDASGSATHLALIVTSLLAVPCPMHPRQILVSVFCVMWLTRLGSFLFARILRDGKDDRFEEIKKNGFRFAGAWTLQVSPFVQFLRAASATSHHLRM